MMKFYTTSIKYIIEVKSSINSLVKASVASTDLILAQDGVTSSLTPLKVTKKSKILFTVLSILLVGAVNVNGITHSAVTNSVSEAIYTVSPATVTTSSATLPAVAPMQSRIAPVQSHIAPMRAHIALVHARTAPMLAHIAPVRHRIAPVQSGIAAVQTCIAPVLDHTASMLSSTIGVWILISRMPTRASPVSPVTNRVLCGTATITSFLA